MTHVKLASKIKTPYKEKGDLRLNFKRKSIEIDRNEPKKVMSFNLGKIFYLFFSFEANLGKEILYLEVDT